MQARLATVLTEMGQLAEAGELLRPCLEATPEDPEIALAAANYRFLKGDLDEAWQVLCELVERQPGHFDAQRLLGQIELARGRYDEALRHLEAAARFQPHDVAMRNALGRTLRRARAPGRREAAL